MSNKVYPQTKSLYNRTAYLKRRAKRLGLPPSEAPPPVEPAKRADDEASVDPVEDNIPSRDCSPEPRVEELEI